ncbi:hypothetical protein AURDEDRAFT_175661 [Auricularia subglabra TFB-10046 SS5]|uniref:Uncharacterized protein n=1 Tax=Auricularia subglabra (strain TFB-10046 / SS5) TaxID=717982 RepID=J0WRG1_AURST|nr:hypothetical protein AURDEDRAFT_175661 [Auricularia subglabra TFB-10046 SS5]
MHPTRGTQTQRRSPASQAPPSAQPSSRSSLPATREAPPQNLGVLPDPAEFSASVGPRNERRNDSHTGFNAHTVQEGGSRHTGCEKGHDRSPSPRSKSSLHATHTPQQRSGETQHKGSQSYDQALYPRDARYNGGRRTSRERAIQSHGQSPPFVPQGQGSNVRPQRPTFDPAAKGHGKTHRGTRAGKSREARKTAQSQAKQQRNKQGSSEGSKASFNPSGSSAPSQLPHVGPSGQRATLAIHVRAGPSHSSSHSPSSTQHPMSQFVSPPPDLISTLLDGPSRKRKRDESGGAVSERPPKRHRWEDDLDGDTRSWLEDVRRLTTDHIARSAKVLLEKEALAREVGLLQTALAEERWANRVLRGLELDESGARWKYVEEETRRLRHPPPRDDSKRYNMYGDTDLSDAYDTDDMFVRSEPDDGHGEDIGRNDDERAEKHRTRTSTQPSDSRPPFRAVSPPRWLASPSHAPSPAQHAPRGHHPHAPAPAVPRSSQHTASGRRDGNGPTGRGPTTTIARKDDRIEQASSMDEVEVEGAAIYATSGVDGPDLNDIDVEHALAAAEEDQRAAELDEASGLVVRSLDAIVESLPHANLQAAMRAAVWDFTSGHRLPMPLGRYGHPHRARWLWGDIDPRRLFKDSLSGSKLAKDSDEFKQLAREAITLPFAARSVTQRVVVGWAHRDGILPAEGWCREPDIMHEARSNPGKISSAVRRRNTVNPEKRIMYTEWDLVDLDCLLLMRMSRPPNVARQLRQTVKVGSDWHQQVWKALQYGWGKHRNAPRWRTDDEEDDTLADFPPVHEYENGPQAYDGDGTDEDVFQHLRRLEDTEVGAYLTRINNYDSRRKALINELTEKYACEAKDLDESIKSAYLSANIAYERIPEGRAIARTCTRLARAHKYYFGQDGVLRYMVKNAVTGLESMCPPELVARLKEDEERARKREADKKRWGLYVDM